MKQESIVVSDLQFGWVAKQSGWWESQTLIWIEVHFSAVCGSVVWEVIEFPLTVIEKL